ncbi:MAG: shikimate dehydrogenase [Planctomyces sp.]|nr:shikimate dehydrogenase [Planctomyces sp.]
MICVSLGRTRHRELVKSHQALAEKGAELVELRIDWLRYPPDLSRVIKERPTAIVVTCRRPQDGGRWRGSEDDRLMLLRQAIASGVDYVDLEEDIAKKIPRYGKTKRIVSYHNFEETPDDFDLPDIYERMLELDADIIKIVTMAQTPADNVRMLQLQAEAERPTVAFCMGDIGIPSRVLCGRYGAPFTYATYSRERVLAPGQLSFDELRDLYRYEEINRETRVFGVLGDPIGHSWSPLIHNTALRSEGINAVYLPLRVPAEQLVETLREFEWLRPQGYSVTIPHKEAVAGMGVLPDATVVDSGAANTLYRNEGGKWCATNTDYEAALTVLREGLAETGDDSLEGKRVLILGAGGVARAIALGLSRAGAAITITNRSKDRGRALAEQLDCQFVGWENRGSTFADVLINCTPIGMFPDVESTPFPQHWLRDGMLVFDTIYNPENTLLLKEAKTHFCRTVSGLEMFVRQAAAQFECFTHLPAPVDLIRETLRRGISPVRIKGAPEKPPGAPTLDPAE